MPILEKTQNVSGAGMLIDRRLREAAGWAVLGTLLLIEFILFRNYILSEVVWAYPPNFDQAAYLGQAYELYEQMRTAGIWHAIIHQPDAPQGALLQLQAALLFKSMGHASRFIALSLNFFYFALFQLALVKSVRELTGRWSVAFLGLALLLTASAPFNAAGGIDDFRMDFIALCLYGTFLCCVVCSGIFMRVGWSVVAGLCGTLLVCFRFITATYLIGLLGIMAVLVVILATIGNGASRHDAFCRLRGILLAAAPLVLLAGPLLWSRRSAIHDYYVVNHVTGAEKNVRAAEAGTTQLIKVLVFYPRNVRAFQAGNVFLISSLALLVGAWGIAANLRRQQVRAVEPASNQLVCRKIPLGVAFYFIVAGLLIPLAILTADVSKSPVVGGILVPPLLWLVMLGFVRLTQVDRRDELGWRVELAFGITAALLVALGIWMQSHSYAQHRWMRDHRKQVENIGALCESIAKESKAHGWNDIAIFTDSVTDYLNARNVEILTYERHGYLLNVTDGSSVLALPEAEVFSLVKSSQFVVLSHRIDSPSSYDYPLARELEQLHPQLEAICRRKMTLLAHYSIFDREVDLFVRR